MGSARIERVVLMMPMSREVDRLNEILKVLSLYRLAFGQPRQEELILNLLHRNFSDDDIRKITKFLVINLAPLKKVTEDEVLPGSQEMVAENRVEAAAVIV
ncbi:MAG: hypothetical protein PF495_05085 [Spirochaetales bacterium]|jgi:hypothetical protein|nr:hypothetical protein [Spirochaetales bacterium]